MQLEDLTEQFDRLIIEEEVLLGHKVQVETMLDHAQPLDTPLSCQDTHNQTNESFVHRVSHLQKMQSQLDLLQASHSMVDLQRLMVLSRLN